MKYYEVSVATKKPVVYATFTVKAKNKEEALKKAKEMRCPDDFDCVSAQIDWSETEVQEI